LPNIELINKYRPGAFDEVVGHQDVLKALQRAMSQSTCPKSYLFSGIPGLGKTTLARIVATELEAEIVEISGATHSGVDNMREIVELASHMSLSGAGRRMFIIDECQRLSKGAWDALLKITEEPPAHLYFAFCTTERNKVPDAIVTRCYSVNLKALKPDEISLLLSTIAELEEWDVVPDVQLAVVQASDGSPRRAISLMQAVHGCEDRAEVRRIISLHGLASEPVLQIAQYLAAGKKGWLPLQKLLTVLDEDQIEGAVPQISGYIAACMKGANNEKDAQRFWKILDALTFPTETYDKRVALYARLGRILWSE
jgi:DNA polymerase-3 subunit gamma/tau